ncbi:putative cytochrome P450 monooxygenase [Xylaria longipes]|nr:putative cytochrome P450 monooxygenase [Xylaria longipes]
MAELWWSSTGRLLLVFAVAILFIASRLVYNRFFHPLRSFPGPWYVNSSIAWWVYHMWAGTLHEAIHELHLKYGPVVRIAPGELSFVEAQAWKDIYGHSVRPEFPKDPSSTYADDPEHAHIVVSDLEKHRMLRKILSHAFSDRALYGQEAIIGKYAMELIKGLRKQGSDPVDMVRWYTYTTFDIIGHLAFAESFDCLSSSSYHPWVKMISSSVQFMAWTRLLGRLVPGLVPTFLRLIPRRITREYKANRQLTAAKLARRREKKLDYTDFAEHLLKAEHDGVLHPKDLLTNLPMLVVAGSETTAASLSGATYYMLTNPSVYTRLVAEIRSEFEDHAEITLLRLSALRYLPAVMEESLRIYPPGNSNHPRVVSPQGGTVCGRFVPGGMLVGVPQWACFRSPYNFARPEEFVPERFLGEDGEFANDKRDALQPFQVGPRNCIGRNLANIEMRLILTHLLLEFDLELLPESRGWENQLVFATGVKPPLMVKLHPVRKS